MPDYFIHGNAVGVGLSEEEAGFLDVELFWVDKYCPEKITVPLLGTIKIPSSVVKKSQSFLIPGISLIYEKEITL